MTEPWAFAGLRATWWAADQMDCLLVVVCKRIVLRSGNAVKEDRSSFKESN